MCYLCDSVNSKNALKLTFSVLTWDALMCDTEIRYAAVQLSLNSQIGILVSVNPSGHPHC